MPFLLHSFQDDFVEKNQKATPNSIHSIIQKCVQLFDKSNRMDSKSERKLKTVASNLRCEIDNLIESLKKTVKKLSESNAQIHI